MPKLREGSDRWVLNRKNEIIKNFAHREELDEIYNDIGANEEDIAELRDLGQYDVNDEPLKSVLDKHEDLTQEKQRHEDDYSFWNVERPIMILRITLASGGPGYGFKIHVNDNHEVVYGEFYYIGYDKTNKVELSPEEISKVVSKFFDGDIEGYMLTWCRWGNDVHKRS